MYIIYIYQHSPGAPLCHYTQFTGENEILSVVCNAASCDNSCCWLCASYFIIHGRTEYTTKKLWSGDSGESSGQDNEVDHATL